MREGPSGIAARGGYFDESNRRTRDHAAGVAHAAVESNSEAGAEPVSENAPVLGVTLFRDLAVVTRIARVTVAGGFCPCGEIEFAGAVQRAALRPEICARRGRCR